MMETTPSKVMLVAASDERYAATLKDSLAAEGYTVRVASDGAAAFHSYSEGPLDLILLDLDLPPSGGEVILRELRESDSAIPILILSKWCEVDTRVRCLDDGADDFLLSPFELSELHARCRVQLRRGHAPHAVLRAGPVELSRIDRSVFCDGVQVELTRKEFAILEYLLLHRGRCVPQSELLEVVCRSIVRPTNVIEVHLNYLRRKLKDPSPGKLILTMRGEGYVIPHDSIRRPSEFVLLKPTEQ